MTDPDTADHVEGTAGYDPPADCDGGTRLLLWRQAELTPDPHHRGYVILGGDLMDFTGEYNKLLVPKVRISGIECPRILDPTALNYWKLAWDDANEMWAKRRPDILVGINSYDGRTQDQFHIHLTALNKDARTQLDKLDTTNLGDLTKWNNNIFTLGSQGDTYVYRVARVDSLDKTNPFTLLNHFVVSTYNDMFAQSLAIVTRTKGGFYLIATQGKKTQAGQPDHPRTLNIGKDWGTSTCEALMDRHWK